MEDSLLWFNFKLSLDVNDILCYICGIRHVGFILGPGSVRDFQAFSSHETLSPSAKQNL